MSPLDRRHMLRLLGGVAIAGTAGGLAGCGSPASGGGSATGPGARITIGLIAPATGPFLAVGADITQGFKLYLEGNGHRLGNHLVDLVVQDEGGTRETALAAAEAVFRRDVLAIVGVANSASLTAIRSGVEARAIPLISANASPSGLTGSASIWRASYVDGDAGLVLGRWAASRYRRAFVLYDETDTGKAEATQFAAAFTDRGGEITSRVRGSGGFAQRLAAAGVSDADVLFAAQQGAAAGQLLAAYRSSGLSLPLIGPGALTETRNLKKLLGRNLTVPDSVYTAMNYAPDLDNEANHRFVANYHKVTGVQPTAYAMVAYDCAAVLDKALSLIAGDASPAALNRKLGELGEVTSPRGTWTFNVRKTPQQQWYLRRLRLDGQVPANLVESELDVLS